MTRVGLTVGMYHDSSVPYRAALEAAGLEVKVMSSVDVTAGHDEAAKRLLADVGGVLLAGGGDIDPDLMGVEPHPKIYGVDANRDRWERAVFEEAWRRRLPIFAVCRGMQVVNWALGGSLHLDIDHAHGVERRHRQTDYGFQRHHATHEVTVEQPSMLHDILQCDRIKVNSIHHQSVDRVAEGFVVTARTDDGVIEAMEDPRRDFALAVQFHPEEMWREHPRFRRLFERFGEAAERFSSGHRGR